MINYTPEEVKDIEEREKTALQCLKDMQLTPAAQVYKQNIGNDMFVDKVTPYLQDTKYDKTPKESPKEDEKPVDPESK